MKTKGGINKIRKYTKYVMTNKQLGEVHIIGAVDGAEEVANKILSQTESSVTIVDISAGQLSTRSRLREKVLKDKNDVDINWVNGQKFASKIGDKSREEYIEWFSSIGDKNISRESSIKEWFVYDGRVSLWWLSNITNKHPVTNAYRWLFYQIFTIEHIASKETISVSEWHVWTRKKARANVLQSCVPCSDTSKAHVLGDKDPTTWKSGVKNIIMSTRMGETIILAKNIMRVLLCSVQTLFKEVKKSKVNTKKDQYVLEQNERSKPLILFHTLIHSWTPNNNDNGFYDRYFADSPNRLKKHGYTTAWLPSFPEGDIGGWKKIRKKDGIPDVTPWMKISVGQALNIVSHRLKWAIYYAWLFIWNDAHKKFTYKDICLGAWLKSSYRGQWATDAIVRIERIRVACEILKPHAVLYRNEFYSTSGRRLAAAIKSETAIIGVQHGMISREHTVYQWKRRDINTPPNNSDTDHVYHVPAPDWFAVFGEYYVDQFREWDGYPPSNVVPIGGLRHDSLLEEYNLGNNQSKQINKLREKLGLPIDQTVILLCGGDGRQTENWFRTLLNAQQRIDLNAFVAVKLHQYHGGADVVETAAAEQAFQSFKLYQKGVYPLMAAADVLVSGASTTVLEANLLDTYAIVIAAFRNYQLYPFEKDNLAAVASDGKELERVLNIAYQNNFNWKQKGNFYKHLYNVEGSATSRLVRFLRKKI